MKDFIAGNVIFTACLLALCGPLFAEDVQKPVVAGYFYPKDKSSLKAAVDNYIDKAQGAKIKGDIIAIITPHAGYAYSGRVAGYAFKAVKGGPYKKAIIVAPSHHCRFKGLSVLKKDSYITPIGKVPIDKKMAGRLMAFDKRISYYARPFLREHAAEVEIPFLQEAIKDIKIVLVLTGEASYENCKLLRDALTEVLKGRDDTLIVVSTDMSHYHPDAEARKIDEKTIAIVKNLDAEELFLKLSSREIELCGGTGVVGAMMAARNLGVDGIDILKYATSGDATGDKRKVVGYFSAALYKSSAGGSVKEPKPQEENKMEGLLSAGQKKRLLEIARRTLDDYIGAKKVPQIQDDDKVLNKKMGAFVTLKEHGRLRGCIGNMIGQEPLYITIRDMAMAAATKDPRFSPVKAGELKDIEIEISVLSPMEKIDSPDEIVMGKHGVMVRSGFRSGVYLPQVAAETGWDKEEFMNSLCAHKAGLSADSWKKGECDIYIFTAEVFGEKE